MWRYRRTALQIAVALREHDLIQILLDLGADPISSSHNGYTALHWLLSPEELIGDRETRQYDMRQPRYLKSRIAASVKALARPLSTQVSAVDIPCKNGKTPLMLAVMVSPTATRTLLDEGAEPNKRDVRGRTALMHFFQGGFSDRSTSILEHLLHAGADSRASNSSGRTVLGYWARCFNPYNKAFSVLASLGALAQRDALVQEMTSLNLPLVVASRLGNAQLCWALLDAGANSDKHGLAASSPLGATREIVADDLDDLMWDPVLHALRAKAYVTTAILLAYGANAFFQVPKLKRTMYNEYSVDRTGTTPLHLVAGSMDDNISHEMNVSEYEIRKSVFVGKDKGAARVPFDTLFGSNFSPKSPCDPLLDATINKLQTPAERQEALAEYMLRNGASVNARTRQGITPLMISICQGQLDLARQLLKHDADPNITAVGGRTPLIVAAWAGRRDLVEALLTSGADPNAQLDARSPDTCSCVELNRQAYRKSDNCRAPLNALALAAERGYCDVVEALLHHGADANLPIVHHVHGWVLSSGERRRQGGSCTPSSSDAEMGLETELKRCQGRISVGTALTWARGEVRNLLLRHGADPTKEEAIRKCDCLNIGEEEEKGRFGQNYDNDYPTGEGSDSDKHLP
ncbi:ankyrin repeat domain-containing protein 29 [Colletotrichum higginsianum IMI 349063]|uniref:Ankyrin repeat domain-containing protein 29 n=1 Tax=Colletotrichum higginsianum (strain IMI 349063) TaxID=759273 RepID=A0A1B7XTJ0_COLHI|nr:ankyrin repeat domain-containing protein 29 [Colletotrichum higginsianum IMI 349063]OBR03081.1 ankyrin repeat domain-containing protein 29 [Colletotrichum higginsianum IMI 349063]